MMGNLLLEEIRMRVSEIEDEIITASDEAKESASVAMNSYGAGYDAGFRDGLERARAILEGQTP